MSPENEKRLRWGLALLAGVTVACQMLPERVEATATAEPTPTETPVSPKSDPEVVDRPVIEDITILHETGNVRVLMIKPLGLEPDEVSVVPLRVIYRRDENDQLGDLDFNLIPDPPELDPKGMRVEIHKDIKWEDPVDGRVVYEFEEIADGTYVIDWRLPGRDYEHVDQFRIEKGYTIVVEFGPDP